LARGGLVAQGVGAVVDGARGPRDVDVHVHGPLHHDGRGRSGEAVGVDRGDAQAEVDRARVHAQGSRGRGNEGGHGDAGGGRGGGPADRQGTAIDQVVQAHGGGSRV